MASIVSSMLGAGYHPTSEREKRNIKYRQQRGLDPLPYRRVSETFCDGATILLEKCATEGAAAALRLKNAGPAAFKRVTGINGGFWCTFPRSSSEISKTFLCRLLESLEDMVTYLRAESKYKSQRGGVT
jgi:hypothetical protein